MSGDVLPPATWGAGVDPDAMVRLRLQKAREALNQGDGGRALVEAEELLDAEPANDEALWLAAEAAFDLGDGRTAILALEPMISRRSSASEAWSLMARCRLDHLDFETADEAARRCLALTPLRAHDEAQAWFVLGIMGRQLNLPGFTADLEKAAALDPGCFSLRQPADPRAWEQALPEALTRLPPPLRPVFAAITIELRDFASNEELTLHGESLSPLVPCQILPPEPPHGQPPTRVVLYTANLRPDTTDQEGLVQALCWAMIDLSGLWHPPQPQPDFSEE